MKQHSIFLLTLCLVIFSNVEESVARKRSEAFRRCLKQMKTSFKDCLLKLSRKTNIGEKPPAPALTIGQDNEANATELVQQPSNENENGTQYNKVVAVVKKKTSAEEKYEIMQELQSTLVEKLNKMPPGKLKINLMERFKKELSKVMKMHPRKANESDAASDLQNALLEQLKKEIMQQDRAERMLDPKFRRKMQEQEEREKLEKEMNKMKEMLNTDLEKRANLQFKENVPSRIRVQVTNTTSLKEELTSSMVNLTESRDALEEMKRTCREIKRIYEIDVSATIDLANYLLQNVDLQIDLMTGVVRLMNYQPNLVAGTFQFDFTRADLNEDLLRKSSTEIYEMTRSFAEMRKLHYKIKDRDWSALANKTGVLFFRMNQELLKQNQRFWNSYS